MVDPIEPEGTPRLCDSHEKKQAALTTFYGDLFGDRQFEATQRDIPGWVFWEWPEAALDGLRALSSDVVREAVYGMQPNKSCGEDMVVVEMLQKLDEQTYELVAEMFKDRLLGRRPGRGGVGEEGDPWALHVVRLLKKKASPASV